MYLAENGKTWKERSTVGIRAITGVISSERGRSVHTDQCRINTGKPVRQGTRTLRENGPETVWYEMNKKSQRGIYSKERLMVHEVS